jgi:hypothetical protein
VRINGGINKDKSEISVYLFKDTIAGLIKEVCTKFNQKEKQKKAVLYSRTGLIMSDDDIQFMKGDDVYYIALDGENFNNFAILDDYVTGDMIGEGGFG